MPDSIVIQQLAEDLTLQEEIIDALWNRQRLADGLEALEEFGTTDQIPAISRLETELRSRMEKAKPILESDQNSAGLRFFAEGLFGAATRAKATIQKRSSSQE